MSKNAEMNNGGKSNKRAKKRPRQNSRPRQSSSKSLVYDLMVPIPKETPSLHIQELKERLANTGFSHMALTHTIFGAPKQSEDKADKAIPESLWELQTYGNKKPKQNSSLDMPAKGTAQGRQQSPIKVLRRLHAVVESLSDIGHYAKRSNSRDAYTPDSKDSSSSSAKLLQEYDLVSLSPRNDASFQSACTSAGASDIITLDYTAGRGGVQLPFKIRPADVKAVVARKAVFEIPYAPAILNRNQRKGLIQTCRLLQMASLSSKPKVILSSGSRVDNGMNEDAGVMALRNPYDLENVLEVVMKFDGKMAYDALHSAGTFVLEQAQFRRFGKTSITVSGISIAEDGSLSDDDAKIINKKAATQKKAIENPGNNPKGKDDNEKESSGSEEAPDDGFIAF